MKKAVKIVIIGLIAACTVAVCYCVAYPFYERWRATEFIDAVAQLRPGVTTESQVREALRSYHQGAEGLVATHWDAASNQTLKATGYGYQFFNKELSTLHLSKPAELSASLFFRDGVLALKTVSLQKGSGTCCLVFIKEADRAFYDGPKDGGSISVEKRGDPVSEMIVNLSPDASDEDRRKAYGLNLGCVWSLSQCDSASSLLHGL
jgi:hypothetical protein